MRAIARRLAVAAVLLCGSTAVPLAAPPGSPPPGAAPPADVERVSFAGDGQTRVVRIHLSSPVDGFSVDERTGRLDVVLHGAHLAPRVRQEDPERPVRSYRVVESDERVTLSFRLTERAQIEVAPDPDSDDVLLSFTTGRRPARRVAGWGIARDDRRAESPPATRTRPTRRRPSFGTARGVATDRATPPSLDPASAPSPETAPSDPVASEVDEPVRPALPPPDRTAPPAAGSVSESVTVLPQVRPEPAAPAPATENEPAPRVQEPRAEERPADPAPAPTPAVEPAPTQIRPVGPAVPEAIEVEPASEWELDTVVLDAGHGGHDYGARANGTSDKEVAWGVVSRLGPMIERELGVRVVYTRDDDTFYDLRERGRIANRAGGKLFISVHANAAASSSAQGTETFFLAPHRESTAREVMERENSVIELESRPELYEEFVDQGDILQAMAMSAYQEESQALAGLIEREFVASGRKSRGVKQAGFIVLWAASMPAVLVETGVITNRDEARFLSSDSGLDATAEAIFRAVRAYKERYERGLAP